MDKQKKYDPAKQPKVKQPQPNKYESKWRRPGQRTSSVRG